jgi:ABC-type antimicrobial peptide transport system permease subunit
VRLRRGCAHVAVALNELKRGGVRVVLAIGAVAVGIAATTSMLALGAGVRAAVDGAAAGPGRRALTIVAGRVDAPPGRGVGFFASTRLGSDDVAALRADLGGERMVAPIAERPVRVKLGNREAATSVRGVTPDYFEVRGLAVARGRLTDELDDAQLARVAVVGSSVAGKLGGRTLGESITLGGVPFTVVGELERKGVEADGSNLDDQILVPLHTAERRLFNARFLTGVLVEITRRDDDSRLRDEARLLLRRNHELDISARDDFDILSPIGADAARRGQAAFLERLLRPLAFVTVAIGGIAILVVTYLNVLDRVPEIGLRMAIGARRRDIVRLFVLEAACSSGLGGLLGAAAAWAGVGALRATLGWPVAIDARVLVLPLAGAILLGVVCGAGPALRAARLTPLAALCRG